MSVERYFDPKGYRSWFCVLNNPENCFEGSPQNIADTALSMWIGDKPTRTGAVAYCVSSEGLHHLHMVLEDSNKATFMALKKAFPAAHLEPTMGTKEQAEDYIHKSGEFEEKGEEVIYVAQVGEIKSNQGKRSDIDVIECLINGGYTPQQILSMQFSFRRYDKMIKDAYFDKRFRETPVLRDVDVYWHVGKSGTGKSYTYKHLCDVLGDDKIYFVGGDYEPGYMDKYNGEPVLFLDEFRGQIRFTQLLSMLSGYRTQVHSRYSNVYALWTEVHITTVLPPELMYRRMVQNDKEYDSLKQLFRRINHVWLHYVEDGEFKIYSCDMKDYKDYETLCRRAGVPLFDPVDPGDGCPFI